MRKVDWLNLMYEVAVMSPEGNKVVSTFQQLPPTIDETEFILEGHAACYLDICRIDEVQDLLLHHQVTIELCSNEEIFDDYPKR